MVEGGGVVLRDRSLPVNYQVIAVLTWPEVRARQGERDIERGREFASKIKMSCFCCVFLGYEFVVGTNVLDHHEWIFQKSGVRVAWQEYVGKNILNYACTM